MRKLIVGLAALSVAVPASAQTMNAEAFYQKAMKLKGKGAMAVFSMGEVKQLMREGQAAGKAAGQKRKAEIAAGRSPRFCPPSEVKMSGDDFLASLGRIPEADRKRIDMTEASTRIMAVKFPCKG